MNFKKILFLFYLSLFSNVACAVETTGFDEICKIYAEVKNSSMTKSVEEFSHYIFDNVKNRVNDVDALEAHTAVFNLDRLKRYSIFKESAEYALKRTWECKEMKEIMGTK